MSPPLHLCSPLVVEDNQWIVVQTTLDVVVSIDSEVLLHVFIGRLTKTPLSVNATVGRCLTTRKPSSVLRTSVLYEYSLEVLLVVSNDEVRTSAS